MTAGTGARLGSGGAGGGGRARAWAERDGAVNSFLGGDTEQTMLEFVLDFAVELAWSGSSSPPGDSGRW